MSKAVVVVFGFALLFGCVEYWRHSLQSAGNFPIISCSSDSVAKTVGGGLPDPVSSPFQWSQVVGLQTFLAMKKAMEEIGNHRYHELYWPFSFRFPANNEDSLSIVPVTYPFSPDEWRRFLFFSFHAAHHLMTRLSHLRLFSRSQDWGR